MAVAFFSDSSIVEKKLENIKVQHTSNDVTESYQLKYCATWITSKGYKRVSLQFPDELLRDASAVEKYLCDNTEDVQYFILADTSYGSCCIDEVAAEHYQSDCIIHFGPACLSPTRRLPVLYLFYQVNVDVEDFFNKFMEALPDRNSKIGILYDVSYYHIADTIQDKVCCEYPNAVYSTLNIAKNATIPVTNSSSNLSHTEKKEETVDNKLNFCVNCGPRTLILPKNCKLEDYIIIYIGQEGLTLNNVIMNWNKCTYYSYNPINKCFRKETLNVNKALMKRYYFIEKVKDANIVGILVGTLGVSNYLQMMDRLKELLKKVGKKYYTFAVGKLNVAKLANFMEIDVYVHVACPENSLVDSTDFYRPIVTPYEVELACNPDREWTGEYVTDFQQLLPGGQTFIPTPEHIEQTSDVSLATGGVRQLGLRSTTETVASSALMERGTNLKVALTGAQNAGEFLHNRQWQGLEPELGKTPVTKAIEGRKGIAISYEEEPK